MQTVQTSNFADDITITGMSLIAKVVNDAGALVCKVFADTKQSVLLRMSLSDGVPVYKGPRAAARLMREVRKLNVSTILAYFINNRVQLVFLNDPSDLPVKGVECGPRESGSGAGSREVALQGRKTAPVSVLKPSRK